MTYADHRMFIDYSQWPATLKYVDRPYAYFAQKVPGESPVTFRQVTVVLQLYFWSVDGEAWDGYLGWEPNLRLILIYDLRHSSSPSLVEILLR